MCKEAAAECSRLRQYTVFMSEPLPPYVTGLHWPVRVGQQLVRRLNMRDKLQLLCTAATSGSEVNLEAVVAMLQPVFFQECFQCSDWLTWPDFGGRRFPRSDPGVSAVMAGHPELLGWLQRHCPGLVDEEHVMLAAVQFGGLEQTKQAWAACSDSVSPYELLRRAAASSGEDAISKMEWIASLRPGLGLNTDVAVIAARTGDVHRLRWLLSRGCPIGTDGLEVLDSALRYADLAVVRWLVEDVGVPLPLSSEDETSSVRRWRAKLFEAAATSTSGLDKVWWLCGKGVAAPSTDMWCRMVKRSVAEGHEALGRYVLNCVGKLAGLGLGCGGVQVGSLAAAQMLAEFGVGRVELALCVAANAGNMGVTKWLIDAAVLPADALRKLDPFLAVMAWPSRKGLYDDEGLLQLIQTLVGLGWREWDVGRVVVDAAERGHHAVVQYLLHARPEYRPDWALLGAVARGGREPLLEWLVGQYPGCLVVVDGLESPYMRAAQRSDLGILSVLRRLQVPWGQGGLLAAAVWQGCEEPALRWLYAQGAPVGSVAEMKVALASRGSMSVEAVAWLCDAAKRVADDQ